MLLHQAVALVFEDLREHLDHLEPGVDIIGAKLLL